MKPEGRWHPQLQHALASSEQGELREASVQPGFSHKLTHQGSVLHGDGGSGIWGHFHSDLCYYNLMQKLQTIDLRERETSECEPVAAVC